MKQVRLPSGETLAALGQGTWRMAEDPRLRPEEIATLRLGIEMGAMLIDTAEMYADGGAEQLVGKAIEGLRDQVFLVSKVYPHNATRRGTEVACERSLKRLRVEQLDLYLLHWPGSIPIAETVEAFEALQQAGKIRHYGVSNFDRDELEELWSVKGGKQTATDQVLYNLSRRGLELSLIPWLRDRKVPLMAYSPLEQGRLLQDKRLREFARRTGRTAAQAALAWLLAKPDVLVIPKSANRERLKENMAALEKPLTVEEVKVLERLFPRPKDAGALEML
jgi:diketogulonate reductase-like aldo/keto reductase